MSSSRRRRGGSSSSSSRRRRRRKQEGMLLLCFMRSSLALFIAAIRMGRVANLSSSRASEKTVAGRSLKYCPGLGILASPSRLKPQQSGSLHPMLPRHSNKFWVRDEQTKGLLRSISKGHFEPNQGTGPHLHQRC